MSVLFCGLRIATPSFRACLVSVGPGESSAWRTASCRDGLFWALDSNLSAKCKDIDKYDVLYCWPDAYFGLPDLSGYASCVPPRCRFRSASLGAYFKWGITSSAQIAGFTSQDLGTGLEYLLAGRTTDVNSRQSQPGAQH